MSYLAYALCFAAGVAAGTYLVHTEHPWFAALVFLMTAALRFTERTRPVDAG